MKENLKQLNDLIGSHFSKKQAQQIAKQLYEAQELADKSTPAEPEKRVLEGIKADIAGELNKNRFARRRWMYSAIAAAACIAVALTVAIKMQTADSLPTSEPAAQTAAGEFDANRELLAMAWDDASEEKFLETEIRSIEFAVYESEQDFDGIDFYIVNIENQINDMQDFFWKG